MTLSRFELIVRILKNAKRPLSTQEISEKMPYLFKEVTPWKVTQAINRQNRGQIETLGEGSVRKYKLREA